MGADGASNPKTKVSKLSEEDIAVLLRHYDINKDGILSQEEGLKLIEDCKKRPGGLHPEVLAIVKKYDTNNDGHIDSSEMAVFHSDVLDLTESSARYFGYTAVLSRAFRYLAFTSDFGEALRPVVHARIVTGTYVVAIGYCFADVGWEAYKLKQRGYVTEATAHAPSKPMTMTQLVVERSVFQAIASVAVPFAIIHTAVDVTKRICAKIGRFQKWGPSIVGLSVIPFLPLYLDHPIEHGLEHVFQKYGPWAEKEKQH